MMAEFLDVITFLNVPVNVPECEPTVSGSWASLSWRAFNWFSRPQLMLPPIFALILLPWFVRKLRRQVWISGLGIGLLVAYMALGSPLGIAGGHRALTSLLPSDSGESADAIVILGRGGELRQARVDIAFQLWRENRAPQLFASGRGDAIAIVEDLQGKGVPVQAVRGEECSSTTEENAQFTAALLKPEGIQRIILVTDPPHMLRSLLTFHSLGFDVIPRISPLSSSLGRQREGFLVLREYLGLASYGLLGRFFPRDVPSNVPDELTASGQESSHPNTLNSNPPVRFNTAVSLS